jgi:uncharacterized protein (DUF1778 family)
MAVFTSPRETTINLRAPADQKTLIDRAAEVLRQTRSSFMLEASVQRAETVLADRTRFALSEEQMARFHEALDMPLPDPEALRRLLTRPPPWAR